MLEVHTIPGPPLSSPHNGVSVYFATSGSCIYQFADGVCAAFDVAAESVVWSGITPDRPVYEPRPRRFETALFYQPRVYENAGLVLHLASAPGGGLWVLARRLESGVTAWDTRIDIPPPERWTEAEWLYEGLSTEELHVSLAALPDRIVVVIQRNSRRCECWTADRHFPMPPFDCGLQLIELDAANGRVIHDELIDRAWIGSGQQFRFDGVLRRETALLCYDWATRKLQTLLDLPNKPHDFVCVGSRILAAYAEGRTPCIVGYDLAAGQPIETMRLARNAAKIASISLRALPNGLLAQVNEARLVRISDDLLPRYELRVRPYVYDAALTDAGVLLIGTDGKGTNAYVVDDCTGTLIKHEAQPGHPYFAKCGENWIATHNRKGVCFVSADGTNWHSHETTHTMSVNGAYLDRVWSIPKGERTGELALQFVRIAC